MGAGLGLPSLLIWYGVLLIQCVKFVNSKENKKSGSSLFDPNLSS